MTETLALAKDFAMSRPRLALGVSWVVGLIVAQIWQVVAQRDDWPLSSYPMYSGLQRPHVMKQELRAVSASGELEFTSEHLEPLSPRTVSLVLRHSNPKYGNDVRRAILGHYYERRASGKHDGPILSSLRQYQYSWAIRSDLSNRSKPKVSVLRTLPAFDPRVTDALNEQSRGRGEVPAAFEAGSGAVVVNLASGELGGGAQRVADRFAADGFAVALPKDSAASSRVSAAPTAYVDVAFRAPAGRYYVWVRGKTKRGTKQDSVWLQFDSERSTDKTRYRDGLGQFRETYPANAFGWASVTPLDKPAIADLAGEEAHVLRVSVREGPLVVDQVVLSRTWQENPGEIGVAR